MDNKPLIEDLKSNHQLRTMRLVFYVIVLLVSLPPFTSRAQSFSRPETILPADTVFLAQTPNLGETLTQFHSIWFPFLTGDAVKNGYLNPLELPGHVHPFYEGSVLNRGKPKTEKLHWIEVFEDSFQSGSLNPALEQLHEEIGQFVPRDLNAEFGSNENELISAIGDLFPGAAFLAILPASKGFEFRFGFAYAPEHFDWFKEMVACSNRQGGRRTDYKGTTVITLPKDNWILFAKEDYLFGIFGSNEKTAYQWIDEMESTEDGNSLSQQRLFQRALNAFDKTSEQPTISAFCTSDWDSLLTTEKSNSSYLNDWYRGESLQIRLDRDSSAMEIQRELLLVEPPAELIQQFQERSMEFRLPKSCPLWKNCGLLEWFKVAEGQLPSQPYKNYWLPNWDRRHKTRYIYPLPTLANQMSGTLVGRFQYYRYSDHAGKNTGIQFNGLVFKDRSIDQVCKDLDRAIGNPSTNFVGIEKYWEKEWGTGWKWNPQQRIRPKVLPGKRSEYDELKSWPPLEFEEMTIFVVGRDSPSMLVFERDQYTFVMPNVFMGLEGDDRERAFSDLFDDQQWVTIRQPTHSLKSLAVYPQNCNVKWLALSLQKALNDSKLWFAVRNIESPATKEIPHNPLIYLMAICIRSFSDPELSPLEGASLIERECQLSIEMEPIMPNPKYTIRLEPFLRPN